MSKQVEKYVSSKMSKDTLNLLYEIQNLVEEIIDIYDVTTNSSSPVKKELEKNKEVLNTLQGQFELASDIKSMIDTYYNDGFIYDMINEHSRRETGSNILLNDNYHEVRDLNGQVITVPDELLSNYTEVDYNG